MIKSVEQILLLGMAGLIGHKLPFERESPLLKDQQVSSDVLLISNKTDQLSSLARDSLLRKRLKSFSLHLDKKEVQEQKVSKRRRRERETDKGEIKNENQKKINYLVENA